MGYVIITKFSGREGINSRCRHFDLLLKISSYQSVTAMTAVTVVTVQVVAVPMGRWRSTVTVATVHW